MKKIVTPMLAGMVLLTACSKNEDLKPASVYTTTHEEETLPDGKAKEPSVSSTTERGAPVGVYVTYSIGTGKHTCDQNDLQFLQLSQMNFKAMFDNSAVYATANPANQNDINMLYGFSEGYDHLINSARIGWVYSGNALKLYAYAYNNRVRESMYIKTVSIGAENICSIKLMGNMYSFTVNGTTVMLPRGRSTYSTSGYQLYPYFGGTETAPHSVSIRIAGM